QFRIRANRTHGDEFFYSELPCVLHQLDTHDRIIVKKPAGVGPIGADSADDGGEMNHEARFVLPVQTDDGIAIAQIVISRTRNEDVLPAAFPQLPNDVGAEEARASGDNNAMVGPTGHSDLDGLTLFFLPCRGVEALKPLA